MSSREMTVIVCGTSTSGSVYFGDVSVTPADATSLARARPLLADVEAAYGRLDATLGAMPGLSPRAALHLRDMARLLPVMDALIDAMEAERFLILTHPQVAEYMQRKASSRERWLSGMRRLRDKIYGGSVA